MRFKAIPGEVGVYHCISRITHGEMRLDARAKEVLRQQIGRVADFCGVEVLTYALLTNHFHLLVRIPPASRAAAEVSNRELARRLEVLYGRDLRTRTWVKWLLEGGESGEAIRAKLLRRMHDLSAFQKTLKQRFSIWYNRTHGTFGALWSARFKSLLLEEGSGAVKVVAAYIDLNAVRAGLCHDPKDYRWSGYGEAMGGGAMARAGIQGVLGIRDSAGGWRAAQETYRALLLERLGSREQSLKMIRSGQRVPLNAVLHCRVRYFTDGAVMGSRMFVQRWFEAYRGNLHPDRRAGPKRMRGCLEWRDWAVFRGLQTRVFG